MRPAEYVRMFEAESSHWWYVGLHELVLDCIAREERLQGRRLKIFDAGCGTGRLAELMSRGSEVEGCDSSDLALRYCRARGLTGIREADLNDVVLPEKSYDVITSLDVLYHQNVRDDVAIMKKFRDALRPGGLLLLNLPAWDFLSSPHDHAVQTRERYRKKTLMPRLRRAGFETELVSYRLFFLFPAVTLYRLLRKVFVRPAPGIEVASDVGLPEGAVNRSLLGLIRLENRILRRCPLPMGTSIFAAVRRPL